MPRQGAFPVAPYPSSLNHWIYICLNSYFYISRCRWVSIDIIQGAFAVARWIITRLSMYIFFPSVSLSDYIPCLFPDYISRWSESSTESDSKTSGTPSCISQAGVYSFLLTCLTCLTSQFSCGNISGSLQNLYSFLYRRTTVVFFPLKLTLDHSRIPVSSFLTLPSLLLSLFLSCPPPPPPPPLPPSPSPQVTPSPLPPLKLHCTGRRQLLGQYMQYYCSKAVRLHHSTIVFLLRVNPADIIRVLHFPLAHSGFGFGAPGWVRKKRRRKMSQRRQLSKFSGPASRLYRRPL